MQPIIVVLAAVFLTVVVAPPSLQITTPARIWAGVNPPPQQIMLTQPAIVPPTPGGNPPTAVQHYAVTVNPTASAGLTIVPASIVLNDANNFMSTYQIIAGTPPTFGANGNTDQKYNITWDAVSDFTGYSGLDTTTGGVISARMIDIVTTEGPQAYGTTTTLNLIQYVPSGPITLRAPIPPPNGTELQISFNTTQVRAGEPIFTPASGLKITSAQPWCTFTIMSDSFTNVGTIGIIFQGSAAPYFIPSLASAFRFSTQLIPVRIENAPTQMLVGVPYQLTVALDIPVPAVAPPISLVVTPSTTSSPNGPAALQFSPASLTFNAGVAAQTMTVTAPSLANVNNGSSTAQMWFTLNPNQYDGGGPFTLMAGAIESPINITVNPRTVTVQTLTDKSANPVYIREPFALEIDLPFPTPTSGGLTVNFGGSVAGGPASNDLWSFDRNAITFTGQTREVVIATLNQWPRSSNDSAPFNTDINGAADVVLTWWLSGVDAPLYSQASDTTAAPFIRTTTLKIMRRTFSVMSNQYPSPIVLVPGVPSEPISVWVSDPDVLVALTGNVTLIPFANSADAMVTFQPSTLSFGPGVPSQSVRVVLGQQPRASGFAAAITVSWAMGGNAKDLSVLATPPSYAIANFPTFTVARPQFRLYFPGNAAGPTASNLTMTAGQSTQVVVSIDYLPASGFMITPSMTEATITPAVGNFSSSGSQVIVLNVTATAYLPQMRMLRLLLSGPDAAYYDGPQVVNVIVQGRSIAIPTLADAAIGALSDEQYISVQELPSSGFVLTPVPASPSSGITFTPASLTFSPTSAFSQSVKWTGTVPGSFYVNWVLSGTDAAWYSLTSVTQQVNIGLRPAPVIGLQSKASITAGYVNSPISMTLAVAPDADLTVTPTASDWVFTPPAVVFATGQTSGVFSAMYKPVSTATHSESAITSIFYTLSGTDSWKYATPAANTFVAQAVERRTITVSLPLNLVVGVDTHGSISLPTHPVGSLQVTPFAAGVTFAPAVFNFDPATMTIHFTATATVAPVSYAAASSQPDSVSSTIPVTFALAGPDAGMYIAPSDTIQVVRRRFLADVRFGTSDTLRDPASGYGIAGSTANRASSNEFIVGRNYSNVMTITTAAPPASSVTLTPTCPYIAFSPASLTFSPDVLSGSISITPLAVPPQGVTVSISWVLGGADELLFETAGLPVGNVNLLPNVVVSPIPAIWIDGVAKNLSVALAPGQNLANSSSFIMSVQPVKIPDPTGNGIPVGLDCVDCVVIEPNTFVFSAAGSGPKTFQIRHTRPMGIPAEGYHLNWMFRTVDSPAQNAMQYPSVAISGSTVRVLRYQIVPDFPFTIGYRTCQASINITRPPLGTLTITPGLNVDNDANRQLQSIKAAGGNIIFTPPQLVFPPGQNAVKFNVRLDRRIDETALYNRVDYSIDAHPEDAACYLPFESTWHVGSASAQRVLLALAVVAPLVLLLL